MNNFYNNFYFYLFIYNPPAAKNPIIPNESNIKNKATATIIKNKIYNTVCHTGIDFLSESLIIYI